jgi:dTDP-4-dehydrorhamnose 3,5-epimerase
MPFVVEPTELPGVLVVSPEAYEDERGWFSEVYRLDRATMVGLPGEVRQVNQSRSRRGVIRGLHFQWDPPMGKLMRVVQGEAFLVAVDIRPGSETLGRWVGHTASANDRRLLWAPAWYARGFCALADVTDVEYFCTATYNPAAESGIHWDDPAIGIDWPVDDPILSPKDASAQTLAEWLARPEAQRLAELSLGS